jgi:hypothetical protein
MTSNKKHRFTDIAASGIFNHCKPKDRKLSEANMIPKSSSELVMIPNNDLNNKKDEPKVYHHGKKARFIGEDAEEAKHVCSNQKKK